MEANVVFSDFTVPINAGVKPQSLATGTTSGNAIALGGPGPLHKLLFRCMAIIGSASANVTLTLYSATASNGTFASIPSASTSVQVSAASTVLYDLRLDTRNEAFADLANNIAWVQPVLVVTNAATSIFLDCIGWESGIQPARRLEAVAPLLTTVLRTELDVYSGAGYSSPS